MKALLNSGVILEGNDGIYAKNRLDSRKACAVEDLFNWETKPADKK